MRGGNSSPGAAAEARERAPQGTTRGGSLMVETSVNLYSHNSYTYTILIRELPYSHNSLSSSATECVACLLGPGWAGGPAAPLVACVRLRRHGVEY